MGKTLDNVYKHQSLVYKYFLYVVSVALIVFFFQKGGNSNMSFREANHGNMKTCMLPLIFPYKRLKRK